MLWTIGKGILVTLDGFFNVIQNIWRYDFFNNEYVDKIFNGAIIVACSWLVLKVLIELVMNYIIKSETRESPFSIYRGIALAIVMMFLVPSLFDFGQQISTGLTEAVISESGMSSSSSAELTISSSIVRAMMYTNETEAENIEYFVANWRTADINETTGGFVGFGDVYKYSINFFMLIMLAIITIFLLFFVAIQMAKRVMEIALYKIIAPFCATSLTSNQPRAFELWCKSSMGAFLITTVQFVGIGLLLTIFSDAFAETGTMAGIFLVIGALLFIISTPTLISTLLNQQSGIASGMQDIQSLVAMGHLTTQGLGLAGAGAMTALGIGANVVGGTARGASNIISGGGSRISDMMNKSKKLTSEQKEIVQDSIQQHNPRKAQRQVSEFLSENSNGKYSPKTYNPADMNFGHFNNTKFNTMRNQYTNPNNNFNTSLNKPLNNKTDFTDRELM